MKPLKLIESELENYEKILNTLLDNIKSDLKSNDLYRIGFNLLDILQVHERIQLLNELKRKFQNLEEENNATKGI